MIDMHSHICFGVDDGSKSLEETITNSKSGSRRRRIRNDCNPAAFHPQFHVPRDVVVGQIRQLRNALSKAGLSVTLHEGQEVRVHENLIQNLKDGEIITLAGSRYILLELPSHSVPAYMVKLIQLIIAVGKVPIIAHPERNRGIAEKPERLEMLVRHGALAQVTSGSLVGHFGKNVQKLALQLIESNLIHTYGSDVHNLEMRPLIFAKGLQSLRKKNHNEMVDILLENNKRILLDKPFIILEPETPTLKRWWQLVH